ncbi:uncharacterized protein [Pyrus communis]|uniref:uncharacterized protein n=1 Tax=Pyrus communis TaxID=23211 RepID=UPI0035BFC8B6
MAHQVFSDEVTTVDEVVGTMSECESQINRRMHEKAEVSNKTILNCRKKSLSNKKCKWPDELPSVLWAYRTTKRQATSETPFSLVYSFEVIIHPNVIVISINTILQNFEQNEKEMATNLDLANDECEKVIIRIASY